MDIENITLKFLQQYNLLESDSVWVVGFSCGYDSMCLLDVLDKIAKSHSIKLVAAHLNHNWRGEESFDDTKRSRNLRHQNH
jgi:tRNA(Ile)-lysidine synthase